MVCTTKFYLIYDKENELDYQQFKKAMFDIQRKVRAFKNLASSEYFSFIVQSMKVHEEMGKWPKEEELLGYKLRNHLYHEAVDMIPELQTGNVTCISSDVYKHIGNRRKDIIAGRVTIPSYKNEQPICINCDSIRMEENDGEPTMLISIFSNDGKKSLGLKNGQCLFKVWHKCESSLAIVKRCLMGEYKVCASQITRYDKSKGMFEFALSYQFDAEEHQLDKSKILGIDLGIAIPIAVAISGSEKRWFIHGDEIQTFRNRTEAMRRSMSKARVYAGDGSVGHGRDMRVRPVDKIGHRIANFRDTKNNAWSREIVDIAVKNGCGTIQMEDLSGISGGTCQRFLKNWTYYDLQQKIRYKAQATGIDVVMVEPKYTSKRCSCCGHISPENRKTQAEFRCEECGYEANADYNAARNIATKDIDLIIKQECEAQANNKTA